MTPTWMIEELERRRQERERCQHPQLRIEPPRPVPPDDGARRGPAPSTCVVIEPGAAERRRPSDPIVIEYASAWR